MRNHDAAAEVLSCGQNDSIGALLENKSGSRSKYEQYIGKGIDTRSNIYSLGITIYFLLTGIEPLVDFEKRIPIDRINIVISEGFALILNKMMELNPQDRYQNGGQFLYALQQVYELDSEYRAYRKRRRSLKLISAMFLITGAFIWGSGFGIWQRERNTNYNRNMVQAEEYIEAGNFGEALLILTDAMDDMPERIEAYRSSIEAENTIIRDCSEYIMECSDTTATFKKCTFSENGYKEPGYYAIEIYEYELGSELSFSECAFDGNHNPELLEETDEGSVTFDGCSFAGNAWDE